MSDTQEPQMPEPVYSVFVRGNLQDTMPYAPAWTLKDGVHALVTSESALAYAEALAAHRVAQERERWATAARLCVQATPDQLPMALDALNDVLSAQPPEAGK